MVLAWRTWGARACLLLRPATLPCIILPACGASSKPISDQIVSGYVVASCRVEAVPALMSHTLGVPGAESSDRGPPRSPGHRGREGGPSRSDLAAWQGWASLGKELMQIEAL